MSKVERMINSLLTVESISEASNSNQVAKIILKQIGGNKALVMTGAKNLVSGENENGDPYLAFKIGRNSSGINYIKIALTSLDLYDVEFGRMSGMNYKVVKAFDRIYADQLVEIIEQTTGMYLSL